ncbi:MAG TPA: LPXTG cell wall anchor domain-containing protein [Propionibacteriaceae bacterium]|nr:LPXTG cell wall anchor domain-containing protein [Propionibacteriaceae bacterium]
MRFIRSLILAALLLLWAVPAAGAEVLEMECPVCDHVDVAGHGLEPNATLTLTITDVKSGQTVLPETRVTTNSSGSFSREYDMDLAKHPSLLANLYESNGNTLVLAAHANASAPAHCRRDASLPYTGSGAGLSAGVAGGLVAMGAVLLLATRRRSGSAAT